MVRVRSQVCGSLWASQSGAGVWVGDAGSLDVSSLSRDLGDGRDAPCVCPTAVLSLAVGLSPILSLPGDQTLGAPLPRHQEWWRDGPFCPLLCRGRSAVAWRGARGFIIFPWFFFFFFGIFVYITLFLHELFSKEHSNISSRSFQNCRKNTNFVWLSIMLKLLAHVQLSFPVTEF